MDKDVTSLELHLALVSDELINTQAELDNERQYQVSMEYLWALDRELLSNLKEHSENLEAKLAKAVEALRKIADHKHFSWNQGWIQNTEARIASAVLAELGENT